MVPREVHVADSKFLALILRYKPEEIGISLDEHGWAATSWGTAWEAHGLPR